MEKLQQYLSSLGDLVLKAADGIKYLLAFLYVRYATRVEDEKTAIEQSEKIKTQQLEIAAEPDASPTSIRDRMRSGDL